MCGSVGIRAGGPCTCAAGRYIRYVLPKVPGLDGLISCRSNDGTGLQSIREHAIPADVHIEVRCPGL